MCLFKTCIFKTCKLQVQNVHSKRANYDLRGGGGSAVVMIGYGRGGGGGGGFGGFPYRSSHRQGQDGRGGGRGRGVGRGRGRRQKRPQKRSDGGISYHAELQVPPNRRGRIVGRGGATLGRLREQTGARIFVPPLRRRQRRQSDEDDGPAHEPGTADNDDVHPVRVNASGLPPTSSTRSMKSGRSCLGTKTRTRRFPAS